MKQHICPKTVQWFNLLTPMWYFTLLSMATCIYKLSVFDLNHKSNGDKSGRGPARHTLGSSKSSRKVEQLAVFLVGFTEDDRSFYM